MTLGLLLLFAGSGRAPRGAAAPGDADLSGVWQLELSARTLGGDFYCRLLPPFHETVVDTIHAATSIPELLTAIVPDSLAAAFDEVCAISPLGGMDDRAAGGDGARAECAMSVALVSTCSLTVRFALIARRAGADSIAGNGRGVGVLHGGCPEASCPGEITLELRRLARRVR